MHRCTDGPGSSVSIVTDYGLDSPVIERGGGNPGGGEIFSHTSRQVLGPT
jgi:hypothetical protein